MLCEKLMALIEIIKRIITKSGDNYDCDVKTG